ncbi:MAG: hypothetical protein OEY47_03345 [Candidatus Bathyarchaeota archaeon]|nr:hypothetical protein [Candidatus Bathyarchaeota archaeon]MDH5635683.1 hypothetical protein [Candidatus Bathyarchaeota archaeon]MDH5701417.1 hypothetical protein [Candidatus Bathyarchaeota archaeon]
MKFTRDVKAISRLLFVLLLLMAMIVGAILSYLWVIGYFITLESVIPEKTTVSIANVTFPPQNTSYFFVTLVNPSYSPTEAHVTEIVASTGKDIHNITEVHPLLPYRLPKGKEETFECVWNWANYTGETVKVIAFVADGSGPTFETETPLVDLKITDLSFNSTISVTHFNVTVQNSPSSVTYVNITEVTIDREPISGERLSMSLPYALYLNGSVSFTCTWDWSSYQDKNVSVAVHTLQGYAAYSTRLTSKPVNLTITNVLFNFTDTAHFNVAVDNSADSPTYVNITRINVTVENHTVQEWTVENGTEVEPGLPYTLNPNSSRTFSCPWNWTDQRDKNVTVTIYTLQGFTAQYIQVTPSPIILEIINPIFNPLETNSFNVTVKNSKFSTIDANVTKIVINVDGISENITDVVPSLQGGIVLPPDTNQTFACSWSWADYSGKNVTLVGQTQEGYSAQSDPVLLKALTIAEVLFNPLDLEHFVVTIQNPTWLNFTITTMNVTVEGMPSSNITDYVVPSLPRMLTPDSNLTFMCEWNWAANRGKNVTITIVTLEGYIVFRAYKIPSA